MISFCLFITQCELNESIKDKRQLSHLVSDAHISLQFQTIKNLVIYISKIGDLTTPVSKSRWYKGLEKQIRDLIISVSLLQNSDEIFLKNYPN